MISALALLLAPTFRMSPAQTWGGGFCTQGEMPAVGDVNGDRRADLLAYGDAEGGTAFLQRTSAIGKAFPVGVYRHVGPGPVAIWAVEKGMLVLLRDGSLLRFGGVGHDIFTTREEVGKMSADTIPVGQCRYAVSPDATRVVLVGDGGRAAILRATPSPTLTALPNLPGVVDFGWARFGTPLADTLVWRTAEGEIKAAGLDAKNKLGVVRTLGKAEAEARLAVGRFRGEPVTDLIVGQKLWPGGDPAKAVTLENLPPPAEAKSDRYWFVGDVDGNGRDDLVRLTRSGRSWSGDDTVIHYASRTTDPSAGYVDSSGDGLLDDWKTGRIKPGGLDLKALGAKVGRRELVVEFERRWDVNDDQLKAYAENCRRFFFNLPIANRDGSKGIALLPILRPPTSPEEHGKRMAKFDDYFPPPEHRGVVHTFYVEPGGPLVSGVWAGNGHVNTDWPTFPHEIGHNFGLAHEGYWGQHFNALYPSLMSYTYSYSLNDRGEDIRYSTGELGGPYSERALPEHMPFPLEKIKHVGYGPYRFRTKADGDHTWVDWNWNGIFEDKPVVADITYSHGIRIGARYDVGRSWSGPALTAVGDRLLMFTGTFPAGTTVPEPGASNGSANLSRQRPGALVVRTWRNDWAAEATVEPAKYWGTPSVVTQGDRAFVGYATTEGPVVAEVRVKEDGTVSFGPRLALPVSPTVVPTLSAVGDRLAILLWSGPTAEVTLRWRRADGTLSPETSLGIRSRAPVGAVGGRGQTLWVSRIEPVGPSNLGRTEMIGYAPEPDRGTLRATTRSWLDGEYAAVRPTLLWRDEPGLDGQGRVYHLSCGAMREGEPWSAQYLTLQIAKPGSGWQYRRYYDPDFAGRDAPGACWYRDDMAYVLRLHDPNPDRNDVLSLGFYGTGASPEPIGDYNDVAHVRDYGLVRSILYAHR
jgi:hypothetical protein